MDRKRFTWEVHLSNGTRRKLHAFWGPEREGTEDAVGVGAMIEEWVEAGKPTKHASEYAVPIKVELA